MVRDGREFLDGFQRAALLTQDLIKRPPAHTTREDYMQSVADLNGDAQDLLRRGLAVGCLVAVGKA
jgi:hypothetical protein